MWRMQNQEHCSIRQRAAAVVPVTPVTMAVAVAPERKVSPATLGSSSTRDPSTPGSGPSDPVKFSAGDDTRAQVTITASVISPEEQVEGGTCVLPNIAKKPLWKGGGALCYITTCWTTKERPLIPNLLNC